MTRGYKTCLVLLLVALDSRADIIVLKNGGRISATNVVEEGGRVSYETAAGRLSVRKELVDRIERGPAGLAPGGFGESGGSVTVAPPQVNSGQGYDDVAKATVRGGSIDRAYLARLENEAQSSGTRAAERVAMAHHAAAQFELQKGSIDQAISHYQRALTFAPESMGALLNIAYLHLRQAEFTSALDYLERARRVDPASADAAKLMGWAYYGANKIEQAVKEWKRALELRHDADVEKALEKARRDQETESDYREGETRHFLLRYYGGAAPDLARRILRTLEIHFRGIEADLHYTPPEPIGVILYTEQAFFDTTRAPSWVGALNDGRMRVPVQGLTSVTPELSRTLKHELTHSFVRQKTRGRAPVWLHEGIAQWMEGQRSEENAAQLVRIYQQRAELSLRTLEASFMGLPSQVAKYAYGWSLAAVEYVVRTYGMGDLERLLDRVTDSPSTEAALQSTLRMDYAQLELETVKYLKRTYVQ